MKTGLQLLTLLLLCLSCKEQNAFDLSPAERSARHIEALRTVLTEAPHGWFVTYFPRTDSLLFTNVSEPIGQFDFRGKYGYGGHCFLMRFAPDGTVETTADYDESTLAKSHRSEYEVSRNSFTQLSFTTYGYLHRLVNDRYAAATDLLFLGRGYDGELLFRTATYIEPAREHIVFRKLQSEEEQTQALQKAHANTKLFQQMKNPQLIIRQGSRIYFRSDIPLRGKDHIDADMKKRLEQQNYQRYHLFLFAKNPYAPNGWPQEVVGLGSGYMGTPEGITFRPGIRYSTKFTFYDFRREGDGFVCELVKVYDPYVKIERWISKHLAPEGEETGIIAEIRDMN